MLETKIYSKERVNEKTEFKGGDLVVHNDNDTVGIVYSDSNGFDTIKVALFGGNRISLINWYVKNVKHWKGTITITNE